MKNINEGLTTILFSAIIKYFFGAYWLFFGFDAFNTFHFNIIKSPSFINGIFHFINGHLLTNEYLLNIGDIAKIGMGIGFISILFGLLQYRRDS